MAISLVGAETGVTTTAGALSVSVNVPVGTVNGDTMIMIHSGSSAESYTTPSGWTVVAGPRSTANTGSVPGMMCYRRTASSEPANYSPAGNGATVTRIAHIMTFRNVNATPIDATTTQASGAGAVADCAVITTVTNGALVLAIGLMDADATPNMVEPSGYTMIQATTLASAVSNGHRLAVASKIVATAGAEDPGAFTGTAVDEWGAMTVAIRPSAFVGTTSTAVITGNSATVSATGTAVLGSTVAVTGVSATVSASGTAVLGSTLAVTGNAATVSGSGTAVLRSTVAVTGNSATCSGTGINSTAIVHLSTLSALGNKATCSGLGSIDGQSPVALFTEGQLITADGIGSVSAIHAAAATLSVASGTGTLIG